MGYYTEIVYNELERELKQQYNIPYLHHRLLPTLKEKVFLPRLIIGEFELFRLMTLVFLKQSTVT
jgi:hypothetical protein